MKHVIVTGGGGFVGSHLCEKFLEAGYSVTSVDSYLTGSPKNTAEIQKRFSSEVFQFVQQDISQWGDYENLPFHKRFGTEGVLHFACPASPIDFDTIPFEILKVDSIGTMQIVDWILKTTPKTKVLLASTSEIYGDPLEHPQKETYFGNVNSVGPRACYDEAKRFSEAYVSTATRRGMAGRIVRIFNTYGPRMRLNDGRVVPEFCRRALNNEPLPVCGDGKQTRSFCYVSDLVDGIFKLYQSNYSKPVNIGNPVERTIIDFAKELEKVMGKKLDLKFLPDRPDDPQRRKPDISTAERELNWQPKISIEEGLRRTVEYFKSASSA